jgi:hypothetical protein
MAELADAADSKASGWTRAFSKLRWWIPIEMEEISALLANTRLHVKKRASDRPESP